jgi:acid stress-induced BolA-like protein IbaG/YrbA
MVRPEDVQKYISDNLSCDFIEVRGDGHHFEAVIVSPVFAGKTMIQQHQAVYGALGDRMREEIHALSMKTYTPEQWAKRQSP